jgi:hypothetical protein
MRGPRLMLPGPLRRQCLEVALVARDAANGQPFDGACQALLHRRRMRRLVERGFARLHNFRRLRIRYERDPTIHTGLLTLACSILCLATPEVTMKDLQSRFTGCRYARRVGAEFRVGTNARLRVHK